MRKIVTLMVLVLVGAQAASAQKVDLTPRFTKGGKTRYEMVVSSDSRTTTDGAPDGVAMTSECTITFSLNVADVGETGSTLEMVWDAIKMSVKSPLMTVEFDSATPAGKREESMLAPILRPLVGQTLTLRVKPDGTIAKVTGGEGIADVLSMLEMGSDQGGVRQLFGPIVSAKSPPGIVGVGESWEHIDELQTSFGGPMRMKTRHTVKSLRGIAATVAFEGTLEPATEDPASKWGGRTINGSSYKGAYVWDTELGQLRTMEADLVVESGRAGGSGNQTRSVAKTRVKRLD